MMPVLSVEAAGRTHVGLVRRRNEDSLYVGRSLLAVADGLGGHVAGDVASAMTETDLAGMGATLVAMLWSGTAAVLANVGDSRAYLLHGPNSNGSLTSQITEDHTYEHLLADAANVPDLPERLSRWLDGRTDGRSPDLTTWNLRPGDRFLLCSDGLSSYVPHDLVHATLNSSIGPDQAADRLITLAIDHGGPDNITVIVADVRAA